MLLILLPVIVPFFQSFGISMAQIFQLQGVFALSVMLFEIPSGYIADLWGKKRCLVVGGILNGVGYSWLLFADTFWEFVLFEFLMGAAAALYSGADVALLYDSIQNQIDRKHEGQKLVGGMIASRSFAEAGAAAINSLILMVASINNLLYVQIFAGWLPFLIALSLDDPHMKPKIHSHFGRFKKIVVELFAGSKMLRLICLNMVLWGMASFYAVWLFQKYWQEHGIPLAYFGWLWASYNLTVALSSRLAHRLERRIGTRTVLILIGVLPIFGYLGMYVGAGIWGIAAGFLFQLGRGFHQVILKDALNQRIAGEFRATINSVVSFGFRSTFFLTGPLVGLSIDYLTLSPTLLLLAAFFALLFLILFMPLLGELNGHR